MLEIWTGLLLLLLLAYAVLDGFDLGVGVLHRYFARDERERTIFMSAIGPFWDGNEVCLLAAGGTFLLAFPVAATAALSGFYLALFLLIWALLGRGLAIELRHMSHDPMWRSVCDTGFFLCSALITILLGAALGNVLRGVPLDEDGYFALTLFTSFRTEGEVGLLDWYTVACGVGSLVALTTHGAHFLAYKAPSEIAERARPLAKRLTVVTLVIDALLLAATAWVRPELWLAFLARPLAWGMLVLAVGGGAAQLSLKDDRQRFVASCATLCALMLTLASCAYPVLLASTAAGPSLTAASSAAPPSSLRAGLLWWPAAAVLAVVYFALVFRHHRGRTRADDH